MKIQNFKEFHSSDILKEVRTYRACSEILGKCRLKSAAAEPKKKLKGYSIHQNSCSWSPHQEKKLDMGSKTKLFFFEHSSSSLSKGSQS